MDRVPRVHVKICGITRAEDALVAAEAGASAIGLNFVPPTPRWIDVETARSIARAVRASFPDVLIVGVVANRDVDAMRRLKDEAELGCLQLHGDEPPEVLEALLPHAYKALRVGDEADVARAATFPGEHVLVDAKVAGFLGGSGHKVDWTLVAPLARARKLTLAGGLNPDNVADAVRAVRPFCVDVASGVEPKGAPRVKDAELVRRFVHSARDACV